MPLFDEKTLRKLDRLALVASRVRAGQIKGERRSTKRGTSVEFADYRDYTRGGGLRRGGGGGGGGGVGGRGFGPARGRGHLMRLLNFLDEQEGQGATDLNAQLRDY